MHHALSPLLRRLLLIVIVTAHPSTADGTVLDSLLHLLPPRYQSVVSQPARYGLQIIYTQIDRDVHNFPHFRHFTFNVDSRQYFYPASLVKLPVAALALEKVNRLGIKGLSCHTPMKIDNTLDCLSASDSCGWCRDTASVESSVKCMLLASDNGSYNRLWEFLTRDYANRRLEECGYGDIRLLHRFAPCDARQNRINNPIRFLGKKGKTLYAHPLTESQSVPDSNPLAPVFIGSFTYQNGVLLPRPFRADFLNYAPLGAIHRLLMAIIFPATVRRQNALHLSAGDYKLLRTWMCLFPSEGGIPAYVPDSGYPDNFKKYLFFGDSTNPCAKSLREFNVVGRAYGFLSDVAYFADFDARVEFFLSAVIFANEDDIVNDDQYEYDAVALPFFSSIGVAVYEHEKTRYRRHRPDLRELKPVIPTDLRHR